MLISSLITYALLAQADGWTPAASPTKASLRGLSAVSENTAWASGANASAMRTLNGGASWQTFTIAGSEGLDFRDVHAFDETSAVLMSAGPGSKSRIYRTQDSGTHWTLTHQNKLEKGFFDSMAFWDRKRGILVGDPVDGRFMILITKDGGKSWTPVSPTPPANEGEGAFAASGTAITVGKGGRAWFGTGGEKGGRVFLSKDWGQTWQVVQTPIRHDSASAGIFSVAFRADGLQGFAVGGDYRKTSEVAGTLAVTSDGGRTWTSATGLGGFRSAIVVSGKVTVLATGPDGSESSRDGGKTWTSMPAPGFHALSLAGRKAWVCGSEGRIATTSVRLEN